MGEKAKKKHWATLIRGKGKTVQIYCPRPSSRGLMAVLHPALHKYTLAARYLQIALRLEQHLQRLKLAVLVKGLQC